TPNRPTIQLNNATAEAARLSIVKGLTIAFPAFRNAESQLIFAIVYSLHSLHELDGQQARSPTTPQRPQSRFEKRRFRPAVEQPRVSTVLLAPPPGHVPTRLRTARRSLAGCRSARRPQHASR